MVFSNYPVKPIKPSKTRFKPVKPDPAGFCRKTRVFPNTDLLIHLFCDVYDVMFLHTNIIYND